MVEIGEDYDNYILTIAGTPEELDAIGEMFKMKSKYPDMFFPIYNNSVPFKIKCMTLEEINKEL